MFLQGDQYVLSYVTQDGDKMPVNSARQAIDAMNPANWMSYEKAKALADFCGLKVAYVLSEEDPYFVIDLDKCVQADGRTLTPFAKEVCEIFVNAYIEVSQSGRGLHIWGRAPNLPPHANKNIPLGLEVYSRKRFIMLGDTGRGNADLDYSTAITAFIAKYLPGKAATEKKTDWTSEPVAEWSEAEDDDELILKACNHKSISANFDATRVTFKDLWENNVEKLANTWPSPNPDKEYDYSSADMSLAQRLAYWTGRNCERVQRIMMRSGLLRDKWTRRPDYLSTTILNACANQTQVANNSKSKKGSVSRKFAGGWVSAEEIGEVFEDCVYVVSEHKALVPSGRLLKPDQFKVLYGGYKFSIDDGKTTRNAWEAFTECPTWRPPTADRVCFRPECEPGGIVDNGSELLVNTYFPLHPPAIPGDVSRFDKLLRANFPNEHDREIIMSYMAAIVQYPGCKFQWAPMLQGPEGNGKTFLMTCVGGAVGTRYTHVVDGAKLKEKGMKFNAFLYGKIFIAFEEVYTGGSDEIMDLLKTLSNTMVEIEGKGSNQVMMDNRANFIFGSNHVAALRIKEGGRRYCPIMCAPQSAAELVECGLTPSFLRELWDWYRGTAEFVGRTPGMYHINHFLKSYPIAKGYNPALDCVRAPMSSNHKKFVMASYNRIEQEILEAVEQGRPGFKGGYISSIALNDLIISARLPNVSPAKRKEVVEGLGYVTHPHLPSGRLTANVLPDGGRPRLWIKSDSLLTHVKEPKAIAEHYEKRQMNDAAIPPGQIAL